MKTLLLILFLVPLGIISQVNPWENQSTKNPWEKKEEPKKEKIDSLSVSRTKVDSTGSTLEIVDSLNTAKENINTLKNDTSKVLTESTTNARRELTQYELDLVRIESRESYKATGTFVGSIISSAVFFILALPVNFGLTYINSYKEKSFLSAYKTEYPKASKQEMKYVKKGIKSKKRRSAIGGSLAGMAITVLVVFALAF